ncbi:DUF4097 family beta strand repeat-containing protein [Actinomadura kijaniata]|uniref:DUF4097 family beta strand repeat-containing protein n=1 Tax=Actinomadura kijaniata TaxID=46161 RepID=UPI0008320F2A|nr:DUF4097 family beta strand repeat-containing protein [Actinomadura kijaniata]
MTATVERPAVPAGPADRPRRRGVWIALAALTAFTVLVPAGLQVVGGVLRQSVVAPPFEYRSPVQEVRVDAGGAHLTFGPSGSGLTRITQELTWVLHRPQVKHHLDAQGVLRIKVTCDDPAALNGGRDCDAELGVRLPSAARVTVTSESGSITARDLAGDVEVRTRSGELNLHDVRGNVVFEAGSGAVRGEGMRSSRLSARAGSGSVDLDFAAPPSDVTVRTGSGAVDMRLPVGSHYRVVGDAGSGGWQVDRMLHDPGSPARIDVNTGAGSVTVGYPRR